MANALVPTSANEFIRVPEGLLAPLPELAIHGGNR
jgi:hypothetical protein